MKPVHFIYSKQQESIIFDYEPERTISLVYINGSWVKYTEINSTGDSNFEDAVHLGIHPSWWVMVGGVIQDTDLASFINNATEKMNANERFEYMADLFYRQTGFMAPGKDSPADFGATDNVERLNAWGSWVEGFYSDLFAQLTK